jgi:acetyltransferase-like isoleucine patch superfamily enzyme
MIRFLKIIYKSFIFNIKYFKFKDAVIFPVILNHNVICKSLKGKINIECKLKRGIVRIGFPYIGITNEKYNPSVLEINGDVFFKGSAKFGSGTKISVGEKGKLLFGDNFAITGETKIICFNKIAFGNDCLLSWDVTVMDTDFHKIIYLTAAQTEISSEIIIGDKNWIGCNTLILKGTLTSSNSVIASGSKVYSVFDKSNVLISGNPGKIVKDIIDWQY